MVIPVVSAVLLAVVLGLFLHLRKHRSLSYLQAPPNPSFLLGNEHELRHQADVGDIEFKWFREYGLTFRSKAPLGWDYVYTADPKAMQYIFQTSGYRWRAPQDVRKVHKQLFGKGIIWAWGKTHQRHRKAMLPAFSVPQLRMFLGIFQHNANNLMQKWKEQLLNENTEPVVNVSRWLSLAALDSIGQSAFEYEFGVLDGKDSELYSAMKDVFLDSAAFPTSSAVVYQQVYRHLPRPLPWILDALFPTLESRRFAQFTDAVQGIGRKMLAQKSSEEALQDKGCRDAISVLIRANHEEASNKRLSDEEVVSELATLLFAGHDTIGNTMSWILWELSKNVKDQIRIREEIAAVKTSKGGSTNFTAADYDSMIHLNAAIKEGLRLHPIVHSLVRQAEQDDLIPLSSSVIARDGRTISEIPVSKGQMFFFSIAQYNRLESIWGEDAHVWNPSRFLDPELFTKEGTVSVGVTSNLMSFSAGLKGCIGWRFALMQMQAVIAELLQSFEFSIPKGGLDIQRAPIGLMSPVVRGKLHEGIQMPLHITPIEA